VVATEDFILEQQQPLEQQTLAAVAGVVLISLTQQGVQGDQVLSLFLILHQHSVAQAVQSLHTAQAQG
jgi:hypothetical protein